MKISFPGGTHQRVNDRSNFIFVVKRTGDIKWFTFFTEDHIIYGAGDPLISQASGRPSVL